MTLEKRMIVEDSNNCLDTQSPQSKKSRVIAPKSSSILNEVIIQPNGIELLNILSYLNHHDCRSFANMNNKTKNILSNEHHIWRYLTLQGLGMKEKEEANIPMKGLDWYTTSSLVASHWKHRKVYQQLEAMQKVTKFFKKGWNKGSGFDDLHDSDDPEFKELVGRLMLIGNNGTHLRPPRKVDNIEPKKIKEVAEVTNGGIRHLSKQILTLFDNLVSLHIGKTQEDGVDFDEEDSSEEDSSEEDSSEEDSSKEDSSKEDSDEADSVADHPVEASSVHCNGVIDKDPRLILPGLDENLSLPLAPFTLHRLIQDGHLERAPFGKGSETIIDLNTRACWKMDIGSKVLIHPDFVPQSSSQQGSVLRAIKDNLTPDLGFSAEIVAQPYQMLIYEQGGMFKPHRDTLRGPNNIGSLVITLPVHGGAEGGNLVLSHDTITSKEGGSKIISCPALGENDSPQWCAFFTDVVHEVKPVQRGYRVTLTFHLWVMQSMGQVPRSIKNVKLSSDDERQKLQMVVGRVIKHWFAQNSMNKHLSLLLVLDHQYPKKLSMKYLRGRDRLLCKAISDSMANTKIKVECSEIHLDSFEKPKKNESNDDICLKRFNFVDAEVWHVQPQNSIWLNRKQFMDLEHNFFSFSYYTGNEGCGEGMAYKSYCLEISHKDHDDYDDMNDCIPVGMH